MTAPGTVLPGQIVTVRLGTDFTPPDGVIGVAVVVDGVPGWFKAVSVPEPAVGADGVKFIFPVTVVIADTAPPGEQVKLEFALLGAGDQAGGFRAWQPEIASSGVASCPDDSDCSAAACGPDPVCGVSCGSCLSSEACSADGQCEPIGAACPEIADCSDRECGFDPVCGTSCGECGDGETCNAGVTRARRDDLR